MSRVCGQDMQVCNVFLFLLLRELIGFIAIITDDN